MKIELTDIKPNDFVYHTGDSSFCSDSIERVKKITVQYDVNSGKPYNVIWVSDDMGYDSIAGDPINNISMYYITPIDQDFAKREQAKIDKEQEDTVIKKTETGLLGLLIKIDEISPEFLKNLYDKGYDDGYNFMASHVYLHEFGVVGFDAALKELIETNK